MISEFIIAGAMVGIAHKITSYQELNAWKTKEIKPYTKVFNEICTEKDEKWLLIDGNVTEYGAKFIISLKNKSFYDLEKLKESIEIAYGTKCEIIQNDNKSTATLDIYTNKLNDEDNKFEPVKLKPYEVYTGLGIDFKPIKINLRDYPHLICSGCTGVGKSEELKMIITNLIYSCNSNQVEIHICNVGNTGDFDDFLNCKQVKSFTEKYCDILSQFNEILHIYDKRISVFRDNKVKNITQYNNKFKNSPKKMSYVYLLIDEIASLYPNGTIDKDGNIKEELYNMLCDMGRRVRKAGIYLVLGIQRPSKAVFSPELKQNINIKLGFNQNNTASSLVAIDSEKVAKIGKRNFLVQYGEHEIWSRSLYVTDDMIKNYIKDSVIPNRTKLDDFNKFLKTSESEPKPKGVIKRKKVIPISEVAFDNINRVKNVEVIQDIDYVIENGHILERTRKIVRGE